MNDSNIHCTGVIEPGSMISKNQEFLLICQECKKEFHGAYKKMTACSPCVKKMLENFTQDENSRLLNGVQNSNPNNEIHLITSADTVNKSLPKADGESDSANSAILSSSTSVVSGLNGDTAENTEIDSVSDPRPETISSTSIDKSELCIKKQISIKCDYCEVDFFPVNAWQKLCPQCIENESDEDSSDNTKCSCFPEGKCLFPTKNVSKSTLQCSSCEAKIFPACVQDGGGSKILCRNCQHLSNNTDIENIRSDSQSTNDDTSEIVNITKAVDQIELFGAPVEGFPDTHPHYDNSPHFVSAEHTYQYLQDLASKKESVSFNFDISQIEIELENKDHYNFGGSKNIITCVHSIETSSLHRQYIGYEMVFYGYDILHAFGSKSTKRGYVSPSTLVKQKDNKYCDTGLILLCLLRTRCAKPVIRAIMYSKISNRIVFVGGNKFLATLHKDNIHTVWHLPYLYDGDMKRALSDYIALNRLKFEPEKRPGIPRNCKCPQKADWQILHLREKPPTGWKAGKWILLSDEEKKEAIANPKMPDNDSYDTEYNAPPDDDEVSIYWNGNDKSNDNDNDDGEEKDKESRPPAEGARALRGRVAKTKAVINLTNSNIDDGAESIKKSKGNKKRTCSKPKLPTLRGKKQKQLQYESTDDNDHYNEYYNEDEHCIVPTSKTNQPQQSTGLNFHEGPSRLQPKEKQQVSRSLSISNSSTLSTISSSVKMGNPIGTRVPNQQTTDMFPSPVHPKLTSTSVSSPITISSTSSNRKADLKAIEALTQQVRQLQEEKDERLNIRAEKRQGKKWRKKMENERLQELNNRKISVGDMRLSNAMQQEDQISMSGDKKQISKDQFLHHNKFSYLLNQKNMEIAMMEMKTKLALKDMELEHLKCEKRKRDAFEENSDFIASSWQSF